jgi:hypothetical protein
MNTPQPPQNETPPKLVEGVDFYFENGLMVLTEKFLLDRGFCCQNNCRHCPYGTPAPCRPDDTPPL